MGTITGSINYVRDASQVSCCYCTWSKCLGVRVRRHQARLAPELRGPRLRVAQVDHLAAIPAQVKTHLRRSLTDIALMRHRPHHTNPALSLAMLPRLALGTAEQLRAATCPLQAAALVLRAILRPMRQGSRSPPAVLGADRRWTSLHAPLRSSICGGQRPTRSAQVFRQLIEMLPNTSSSHWAWYRSPRVP